jgi:hypothetical protein
MNNAYYKAKKANKMYLVVLLYQYASKSDTEQTDNLQQVLQQQS